MTGDPLPPTPPPSELRFVVADRFLDEIGLRIAALPHHAWSGYEWEWSCSDDYHDGQYCEHPEEHEDLLIVSRARLQAVIRDVLLARRMSGSTAS